MNTRRVLHHSVVEAQRGACDDGVEERVGKASVEDGAGRDRRPRALAEGDGATTSVH